MTYEVTAEVIEPVCIAKRHGAGNEYASEDFIPAVAIWGALAGRTGVTPCRPPGDDFLRAFYAGDVAFTNLYPESDGRRALPVPSSARTSKTCGGFSYQNTLKPALFAIGHDNAKWLIRGGVQDWLLHGPPRDFDPDMEPLGGWYVGTPPTCEEAHAPMVLRGHVDRSPVSGTAKEGALFTRQNLERGTRFTGAIHARTVDGEQAIQWLMGTCFDRGESRSPDDVLAVELAVGRQPGLIQLEAIKRTDPPGWMQPALDEEVLTITMLSPAIVLDEWLNYRPHIPASLLKAELAGLLTEAVACPHYSALGPVYGWNAAHGRAREVDLAIAPGSAFSYLIEWAPGVSQQEKQMGLDKLQRKGLGLRRPEGFGEIRVNDIFHRVFARGGQP